MMHYKLVKVILNAPGLLEVIINIVVQHYGLLNFIISNCRENFIFKF